MRAPGLLLFFALCACGDLSKTEPNPVAKEKIAKARYDYEAAPNDPLKIVGLADAYADGSRLLEAADGYQKALELGSKDPRIYGSLAAIYCKLGYLESAVDNIKTCMQMDKNHPDCMYALGLLFETDGSRDMQAQARRAFYSLLEVAPNHPKAALVKSKLDQLNARLGPDTDPAPTDPHGATEEAPAEGGDDPHAQIPGHDAAGDKDDIGELNPFGAALQNAFAAVKKNDAIGAEKAFREALALQPNDPTALAGIAQSLLAQNKKNEAIDAADQALKADPKDPQARYTLGLTLLRGARSAEDVKRGLATWEALVKDDPEYAKKLGVQEQLDEIARMMKQKQVH